MYASSISTSRISQGAEAARAAALQAEFNEKKWVWVPDDKDGYLAGWVAREEDEMGEVVMAAGGDVRFPSFFFFWRGPLTGSKADP
jgi:myosin protein heavy chain